MEGFCTILHEGRVFQCEYCFEDKQLFLQFGNEQEKIVHLTVISTRRWVDGIRPISYFPWNTMETSSETLRIMIPLAFNHYITLHFETVELKNQFKEIADTICGYH